MTVRKFCYEFGSFENEKTVWPVRNRASVFRRVPSDQIRRAQISAGRKWIRNNTICLEKLVRFKWPISLIEEIFWWLFKFIMNIWPKSLGSGMAFGMHLNQVKVRISNEVKNSLIWKNWADCKKKLGAINVEKNDIIIINNIINIL